MSELTLYSYNDLRRDTLIRDLLRLCKVLGFHCEVLDRDSWQLKRGRLFKNGTLEFCVGYLRGFIDCAEVAA